MAQASAGRATCAAGRATTAQRPTARAGGAAAGEAAGVVGRAWLAAARRKCVCRHCPTAPRPSTGNPGPLATSRRCFPCLACRALPSRHTVSAVSPWTSRQPAPERAPAAASHPLPAGPCPPSQEQRCATPTAAMLVGESRRIPACPIEPCRHCWPRLHPRPHVNGRVGELRSIKRNRESEDARAGQPRAAGAGLFEAGHMVPCRQRAGPRRLGTGGRPQPPWLQNLKLRSQTCRLSACQCARAIAGPDLSEPCLAALQHLTGPVTVNAGPWPPRARRDPSG